jgi:hypothetical protein
MVREDVLVAKQDEGPAFDEEVVSSLLELEELEWPQDAKKIRPGIR